MEEGIIVVITAVALSVIGILFTTGTAEAIRINGGPCNDNILHSLDGVTSNGKAPDGRRDFIDCGPGNDFAVINVSGHMILAHQCCPISVNNTINDEILTSIK
jgi:hypothetical protein